jgi:hypothetical protein
MINLFNLMPIGTLDGGRVAGALSKYFLLSGLGIAGLCIYTGALSSPLFYLIALAASYSTAKRFFPNWLGAVEDLPLNYYNINNHQRLAVSVAYLGLIIALLAAMEVNRRYKKSPRQIMSEMQQEKEEARKTSDVDWDFSEGGQENLNTTLGWMDYLDSSGDADIAEPVDASRGERGSQWV